MAARLFLLPLLAVALPLGRVLFAADGVTALVTPSGPDSGECSLFSDTEGTVYMTWCEPGARGRRLCLASLRAGAHAWSAPTTIVETEQLMENWADFPSLVVSASGRLTAQWFQKREEGRGYDGWMSESGGGGAPWTDPVPLGHEFVSLSALPGERTLAVWLESLGRPGKNRQPGAPTMALRARAWGGGGSEEWQLDGDTCTCCQTSLAPLPGGRAIAVYRGHTAQEIRDHRVVHFDGRRWSTPRPLHADGWVIAGCPVNGPALDTRGAHVGVAWFTAAQGRARVQMKFSWDGGYDWGPSQRVDLGKPVGRVDLVMLPDGSAVVSWLEGRSEGAVAGVYLRRFWPQGMASPAVCVAETTSARASGFPRLANAGTDGRSVVVAWTAVEPGGQTQVRCAAVAVAEWRPTGGGPGVLAPANGVALEWCTNESSVLSVHRP